MTITTTVPAGNALIDRVAGNDVWLRPDLRDTAGEWFWWSIGIRAAAGQTARLHFAGHVPLAARGPALSFDGGQSWRWGEDLERLPDGVVVPIPTGCAEARVAMAVPYTLPDLEGFLAGQPAVRRAVLCRSRQGSAVPVLTLAGPAAVRVLVTARHHACESAASFAVEGLLAGLAGQAAVTCVPFVDYDGVVAGDQGKNRQPHDHNRDYGIGQYPEVAAIQRLAPPTVAVDLHCPWIRDAWNEHIYAVGPAEPAAATAVQGFVECLQRVRRGPLPVGPQAYLPFGTAWNTTDGPPRSFSRWWRTQPAVRLVVSFELPYANARLPGQELAPTQALGAAVTPASARAFGRDLAAAVVTWSAAGAGAPADSRTSARGRC